MGGTFNPIHYGHLVTAEEALKQFNLDKVIFIPTGIPPHKISGILASTEDRYLMTVIATASNRDFFVSRIEIDREGKSYTIDTLHKLKRMFGKSVTLYFITGADAILEILNWKKADKITGLCKFIAATRPGYDISKIEELKKKLFKNLKDFKENIFLMEIPALAISSTEIRSRIKSNRPVNYLLPEGVCNYLLKHELYK
ncbi:MAG: nicotinate-nucleotide adenylyltransferase [Actinobacteria bacterium]|nr:nicotinate-nucleotide adenylyltransferase [Actinomycetota bacterium]MBM3712319.1 nicotinate-nucleotide adenylyltransferase [Actinomycetota bacterium]